MNTPQDPPPEEFYASERDIGLIALSVLGSDTALNRKLIKAMWRWGTLKPPTPSWFTPPADLPSAEELQRQGEARRLEAQRIFDSAQQTLASSQEALRKYDEWSKQFQAQLEAQHEELARRVTPGDLFKPRKWHSPHPPDDALVLAPDGAPQPGVPCKRRRKRGYKYADRALFLDVLGYIVDLFRYKRGKDPTYHQLSYTEPWSDRQLWPEGMSPATLQKLLSSERHNIVLAEFLRKRPYPQQSPPPQPWWTLR